MSAALRVSETLVVPAEALRLTFSRASGPGGQNVNKVSSRVALELDVSALHALTPSQFERLRRLAGRRLSQDGVLRIVSQATRDQHRNVVDAREKLRALLEAAEVEPKARRPTKVSRAKKVARVQSKRLRSQVKRGRQRPEPDSD